MSRDTETVKDSQKAISDFERKARIDLAALYRMVAMMGWDDLIFTHISARIPAQHSLVKQADGQYGVSKTDHFLINPYGLFFEEMTASSLVKIDIDGKIVSDAPAMVNPAGFTIHSAIHSALHQANYVIHLHTPAMIGVAAQKEGLLPLSQNALLLLPEVAYHDYEGVALDLDERARLINDIGQKHVLILRNHGSLTWGQTAGEAFTSIYFLELACQQQIAALSAGRDGVLLAPQDSIDKTAPLAKGLGMVGGLIWPGLLRRLDRTFPGYAE